MAVSKVKCIYCNKKIVPNQDYCPKCGRDIRSMWQTDTSEENSIDSTPMYCPNPRCHALYTRGTPFCNLCGNDFKRNPPIPESDFTLESVDTNRIYCPKCGAVNNNSDLYCDCGCDFRINPRLASPPQKRAEFFCAVCGVNRVLTADGICTECKKKEEKRVILCPECKINPVPKFGDICPDCIQKKPLRGTGTGFHVVK